jgi:hypothetical protein
VDFFHYRIGGAGRRARRKPVAGSEACLVRIISTFFAKAR